MEPQTGENSSLGWRYRPSIFQNTITSNQLVRLAQFLNLSFYANALRSGIEPCEYIPNEQVVYAQYEDWSPRNADGIYGGAYSLEGGLTKSVNTISVDFDYANGD